MKRKDFLRSLLAIPVIGSIAKRLKAEPKDVEVYGLENPDTRSFLDGKMIHAEQTTIIEDDKVSIEFYDLSISKAERNRLNDTYLFFGSLKGLLYDWELRHIKTGELIDQRTLYLKEIKTLEINENFSKFRLIFEYAEC